MNSDKDFLELGNALQYFFNNAKINIWQGNIAINLMDYFPLIKQGFALKGSLMQIMFLYARMNELITLDANFLIPDELFIKSFNNDIAAEFFCDKDYHRITMQEAFDQKLIVNHMNTFQVVKRVRRIFDPEKFSLCFLQTICS